MNNANKKLHEQVRGALEGIELPSEDDLREMVDCCAKALTFSGYNFSLEDIDSEIKLIQSQYVHRMDMGALLFAEEYTPWLEKKQGDIKWYYWERYKKYLSIQKNLSNNVVNSIDSSTDKILDHIEDPEKEGSWARRGLVVGDVQSGKTANYTGLICKAADAGYKVIIVLAGMINSLRNQTQARLDNDFMGWCTIKHRFIGSSMYSEEKRHPICFTTAQRGFAKNFATQIAMNLESTNEVVLFVVKKNLSVLNNLYDWLKTNNGISLQKHSLLLIDDEADHASINTNKEDMQPTAINKAIRNILSIFMKSSMVGYTATPFANIFIDPETEDDMVNGESYKDLYPKDFIFSLEPPTNYIGPKDVFSDDDNYGSVRRIDDNEDILPVKHKNGFDPNGIPESLRKAIRCFILARAIRLSRKQSEKHHTMMINVSRFVSVQNYVKGYALEYVKDLRNAINNHYMRKDNPENMDTTIYELYKTWQCEFKDECEWQNVRLLLKKSIDPVAVLSVNSQSTDVLDYGRDSYPQGRSVIVVGGLSLSRGITLEGLIVSYFLRNSIMYDTLMQMGRWFGYRDGYQDLCRVFLTDRAYSWYSYITESIDELRKEIVEMSIAGLTPLDFGLKVRAHPESLIVTARNKMRSGRKIPVSVSLFGRMVQTSVIYSREEIIKSNLGVIEKSVEEISKKINPSECRQGLLWKSVPREQIISIVCNFNNHPMSMNTQADPIVNYLYGMHIMECDVLLISNKKTSDRTRFAGYEIGLRDRTASCYDDKYIEFAKRNFTSKADEGAGIPEDFLLELKNKYPDKDIPRKEYRKYRMKYGLSPLFVIQILQVTDRTEDRKTQVAAFGISFPGDPVSNQYDSHKVSYVVDTTWWKNNFYDDIEEEDE